MTPQSNYPTLSALFADMEIIAHEAFQARQTITLDDFRRAGLSANGVVLDATEGVRRAFNDIEIRDFAPRIIAQACNDTLPVPRGVAVLGEGQFGTARPSKLAALRQMRADADAADCAGFARNAALAVCGLSLGAAIFLGTAHAVGL